MPNWCSNNLVLRHQDPEMIRRVVTAIENERLFSEFVPVPEPLKITAGQLGDIAEQEKLEVLQEANRETYGYANWYDFCVNEWGTKWEADTVGINSETENEINLSFDTAWAPPVAFYEKMMHLGFDVVGQFYEPGMAFVGTWDNGFDESYEIPANVNDVRESIPQHIDEFWNISEQMESFQNE